MEDLTNYSLAFENMVKYEQDSNEKKKNKAFMEKNVGKKTKINPVPEQPFFEFIEAANRRGSDADLHWVHPGQIEYVANDPILKVLKDHIPTIDDFRSGFFTHSPPHYHGGSEDRASLVRIFDGKHGFMFPFNANERNIILKGVEAQIENNMDIRNQEADRLLTSMLRARDDPRRWDEVHRVWRQPAPPPPPPPPQPQLVPRRRQG